MAVVVAFGQILPRAVLDAPRRGSINVHGSLLPRYRGAAPIQWAIMRGETVTGITTFQMDEGMDTGPMLRSASVTIGPEETAGELAARLSVLGAEVLVDTLAELDTLTPRAQRHEDATLAPRLKRDGRLSRLESPGAGAGQPDPRLQRLAGRPHARPGRDAHDLARDRRRQGTDTDARHARAARRGRRAGHRGRRWLAPPDRGPAGKPPRDVLGGLSAGGPSHAGRHVRDAGLFWSVAMTPPRGKAGALRRLAAPAREVAVRVLERVETDASFADLALDAELAARRLSPARRRAGHRARVRHPPLAALSRLDPGARIPAGASRRSTRACA